MPLPTVRHVPQVLGFASRTAAEQHMLANPETTQGAVHFNVDTSGINYIIQTNTTVSVPHAALQAGC